MPIYPYRCAACGFETEVMRKISDPLLTTCPKCQSDQFTKQLTAPGFQLKGTGWYATDFKNSGAKPPATGGEDKKPDTAGDGTAETAKPAATDAAATASAAPPPPVSTSPTTPAASSGPSAT